MKNLKTWFESEKDAIPLSIIFLTSPLSPLTTIHRLKRLGLYEYLPEPSKLFDEMPAALSGKMKETLKTALLSHRSGSREVINQKLSEIISRTETELELADYNLTQLYQFVSVFTTLVPSIIASVLFFMNLEQGIATIIGAAVLSVFAGFLGLTVFPSELRLPSPPKRYFLFLLGAIPLYLFLKFEMRLLLSITFASIATSLLSWIWVWRELKILKEARELVRKACTSVYNIFKALEIDDPDYLLHKRWFGIAKAATTSLYLLALHGSKKLSEILNLLESYCSRYHDALFRIRSKTRVMMFYAMLEALVVSAIYAMLVYTLIFFTSIELHGVAGYFYIPSQAEIVKLRESLDLVLSLNAIGLSIATSSSREGNPLYFVLYLPLIAAAMWIGYTVAFGYAPTLFR